MIEDPYQYLDISWRSALLLCFVCPIVVSAFTLTFRQVEQTASRYLAAFLIVFCINLVPQIIGFSGFYQAFPWLTFAPFNNELWLGPLLLMHTFALTKKSPPSYLSWMIGIAALQTSYYAIAFVVIDGYEAKWAYTDDFHSVYILPIESLLTVGISLFCTWCSYRQIQTYKIALLDIESDQDTYDIRWLGWLIALIGTLVILWSGFELFHRFVERFSYPNQYPFHIVFLSLILLLSQRALSSIRMPFPVPIDNHIQHQDSDALEQLATQIERGINEFQWYLNQQFSLSDLARALNTNETYVSRAINQHLKKNFNTLVNEARVEHAKGLLQTQPKLGLIDIMYDAGFSSKASFNRCFKAATQQTPSQYQKSQTAA